MKNLKQKLNGNLLNLVKQTILISHLKSPEIAQLIGIPELKIYPLASIIVAARADGCSWVWSKSEIKKEEAEEGGSCWALPSVDLNDFFDWEEGHNSLEKWIQSIHKTKLEDVIWDTEYSAWYPKFITPAGALACIKFWDNVFDIRYLEKLKAYSAWD